jgi:hypothetical protein
MRELQQLETESIETALTGVCQDEFRGNTPEICRFAGNVEPEITALLTGLRRNMALTWLGFIVLCIDRSIPPKFKP